jgi:HSP20 family molecular chaperone IbpA
MNSNFDLALLPESALSFFGRPIEDVLYPGFAHALPANVSVDDSEYTLEISVPGMSRKDISIVVEDNLLVVTANRKDRKRREDETEFKTTFLKRSFPLPDDVDVKSITASCSHGLLRVRMNRERTEGRRIPVSEIQTARSSGFWEALRERMRNAVKKLQAGK